MSSFASTSSMAPVPSGMHMGGSRWYPGGKDTAKPSNLGRGKMAAVGMEELDLRLENERKLHEMREQGKQILLQREGHGLAEEGAANLLARFHNLHWKRQHHLDSSNQSTSQQASREPREGAKVLIPIKHNEDDYFPGTRQPKKTKNPKIFKQKKEVLQLEEVEPVNKNILPAGYQPCTTAPNAWSLRKGSDLFDHCKLNLTIHGPDDTDEVLQRALEESLITLKEEQNRIVNMYSGSCPQEKKENKVWNPLPNEMVESWNNTTSPTTGAGDGAWMQNNIRSSQVSAARNQFANAVDETSNPKSNYGASLPENSSYDSRSRAMPGRQQLKSRAMNGTRGSSPTRERDRRNSESKDHRDDSNVYGRGPGSTETRSSCSGAGDGHYTSSKEEAEATNGGGWKPRNEENLESLGFSKTRSGNQNRNTYRGRQDFKQPSNIQRGSSFQDDERKKTETRPESGPLNRRPRHISFSEPLVQNGRRGSSTPTPGEDSDPWLENSDVKIYPPQVNTFSSLQTKKETENICSNTKDASKVLPQRTGGINQYYKQSYNSSTMDRGVRNFQKPPRKDWTATSEEDKIVTGKHSEEAEKKPKAANVAVRRPSNPLEVLKMDKKSSASVPASEDQKKTSAETLESSQKPVQTSLVDVSPTIKSKTGVESEEIKRMRKQIEMLDHRLRSITCALEENGAVPNKPVLKGQSAASTESSAGTTECVQLRDAGCSKVTALSENQAPAISQVHAPRQVQKIDPSQDQTSVKMQAEDQMQVLDEASPQIQVEIVAEGVHDISPQPRSLDDAKVVSNVGHGVQNISSPHLSLNSMQSQLNHPVQSSEEISEVQIESLDLDLNVRSQTCASSCTSIESVQGNTHNEPQTFSSSQEVMHHQVDNQNQVQFLSNFPHPPTESQVHSNDTLLLLQSQPQDLDGSHFQSPNHVQVHPSQEQLQNLSQGMDLSGSQVPNFVLPPPQIITDSHKVIINHILAQIAMAQAQGDIQAVSALSEKLNAFTLLHTHSHSGYQQGHDPSGHPVHTPVENPDKLVHFNNVPCVPRTESSHPPVVPIHVPAETHAQLLAAMHAQAHMTTQRMTQLIPPGLPAQVNMVPEVHPPALNLPPSMHHVANPSQILPGPGVEAREHASIQASPVAAQMVGVIPSNDPAYDQIQGLVPAPAQVETQVHAHLEQVQTRMPNPARVQVPVPAQVDPAGMAAYVAQLQQHQHLVQQQQLAQQQQLVQHLQLAQQHPQMAQQHSQMLQQQQLVQHPQLASQHQQQQQAQQQLLMHGTAPATSGPSSYSHPLNLGWVSQAGSTQVLPGAPSADWFLQMAATVPGTTPTSNPNSGQQQQDSPSVPQTSPATQTNAPNTVQNAGETVPTGVVGGPQHNVATQAQWLTQLGAWQQEQQRMAHFMTHGMMPGMVPRILVQTPQIQLPQQQQVPLQQSLGCPTTGVAWPVANTTTSQFEGDWVISPSEEARLVQGLRHPGENSEGSCPSSSDSSLSKNQSPNSSGTPETFPAHLAGLKNPGPQLRASGSRTRSPPIDLSAFNPSMPPPEAPILKGVRGGTNTQLDEPRGRGRLR